MKNLLKHFRIIGIIAIVGICFINCENDDGDGYLLDGLWDRGDIVVHFYSVNGYFKSINSNSVWNGKISIGSNKFRYITYRDNRTWTGKELVYNENTQKKDWVDTKITMDDDTDTIRIVTEKVITIDPVYIYTRTYEYKY